MKMFNLPARLFSKVFWEGLLEPTDERKAESRELFESLRNLETLRTLADYNTGSITNAAAWCLYSLIRNFQPSKVIEIGTFIGKSTWAIAKGIDDNSGPAGEIFTCDQSNEITIPWTGRTKLFQFSRNSSTNMLKKLSGEHEFCFFDGRLSQEDLTLLDPLINSNTIIALDDFEGMEKGVINLINLKTMPKLANHFLVYPASQTYLSKFGVTTHSTIAILLPLSRLTLTNQG